MKSIRPSVLLAALLCMILAGFIAYHVFGGSTASQPALATVANKPPAKGAKGQLRPSARLPKDNSLERGWKRLEELDRQTVIMFREQGKKTISMFF